MDEYTLAAIELASECENNVCNTCKRRYKECKFILWAPVARDCSVIGEIAQEYKDSLFYYYKELGGKV